MFFSLYVYALLGLQAIIRSLVTPSLGPLSDLYICSLNYYDVIIIIYFADFHHYQVLSRCTMIPMVIQLIVRLRESCIYFSHIPHNRVITIMYHTLLVESVVGISVNLLSTW